MLPILGKMVAFFLESSMEKQSEKEPGSDKLETGFAEVKTVYEPLSGRKFVEEKMVFKPITPREMFKYLAYGFFGIVVVAAVIIIIFNFILE